MLPVCRVLMGQRGRPGPVPAGRMAGRADRPPCSADCSCASPAWPLPLRPQGSRCLAQGIEQGERPSALPSSSPAPGGVPWAKGDSRRPTCPAETLWPAFAHAPPLPCLCANSPFLLTPFEQVFPPPNSLCAFPSLGCAGLAPSPSPFSSQSGGFSPSLP